jgi:hypothetical protein
LHEGQDTKDNDVSMFINTTRPTMKDINNKYEKNSGVVVTTQ